MSIVLTDSLGNEKAAPRNAQMSTKIYFWFNPRTQHIYQGGGPEFDPIMPTGYERITCNHAHEAEAWSARLRDQGKRLAEANDEERDAIEGRMAADLKTECTKRLRETPNKYAALIMQGELKRLEKWEKGKRTKHESYLHVEAFENGK